MTQVNALSVDVEDYFQVSAHEKSFNRADWDSVEHRIENNLEKTFALFSEGGVKATFFTLGWIAKRYPHLVKKIIDNGHELASHGYYHQRVVNLTPEEFRADVVKARQILQDIAGVEVTGYRAPSYSIGKNNLWALDILVETGHLYSSSIYPVKHDLYGFPEAPRFTFRDQKTGIIEIPITTLKLMSRLFPAGGGGFFRLYPYALSKWAINRINRVEGQSALFYFHPWELDPLQPRPETMTAKTRFRHYLNLDKTESRLRRLLNDFEWDTMSQVFIENKTIPVQRLS